MAFDPSASYDRKKCRGCGVCSAVCPVSAVNADRNGLVVSFSSICIGCGHCGCYCPWNCFGLEAVDGSPESSLEGEITALIKNRRSTRKYLKRDLSQKTLDSLLEPVGYSPTGHNDQGIRVMVLSGGEKVRRRAVEPVVRLLRAVDSFRLVTLLAGSGRKTVERLRQGEDLIAWGAPCVLFFSAPLRNVTGPSDCVIAASLVSLKAEAMGLGSLWNGVLRILSPFLGFGRASAVLCVGYPEMRKYQKLPVRRWKRLDPD